MNYAAKWNKLDSLIFFCESKLNILKQAIEDSRESDPDPEEMILAETEYLRSEIESLKERDTPDYMIEKGKQYFCPKCRTMILDPEVKYCSNCGKRVIKDIPFKGISEVETP